MNYYIIESASKSTGYYLEIIIAVIVGILIILSIVILTILKKLKDK